MVKIIIALILGFLLGISYVSWIYRDAPRTRTVVVRDDQSAELYAYWKNTLNACQAIVRGDDSIITQYKDLLATYDDRFNGGRPIAPDRVDDIDSTRNEKEHWLDEVEKTEKAFEQLSRERGTL